MWCMPCVFFEVLPGRLAALVYLHDEILRELALKKETLSPKRACLSGAHQVLDSRQSETPQTGTARWPHSSRADWAYRDTVEETEFSNMRIPLGDDVSAFLSAIH